MSLHITGLSLPTSSSNSYAMCDGSSYTLYSKICLKDEVTNEMYELYVSDGKLEIRATSKEGIRQQKIENIIKEDV